MSVTYPSSIIDQRLQVILDALDAGSSNAILTIGTAGMAATLSGIRLDKPSASISGGVLTFVVPRTDFSADTSGVPAEATVSDSDGNVVISGLTVGTANTDLIISQPFVNANDIVSLIAVSQITGR